MVILKELRFLRHPQFSLTPFTPCPLFPLSKLERGTGGEVEITDSFSCWGFIKYIELKLLI